MPSVPPPQTVRAPAEEARRRERLWNAPAGVVLGLALGLLGTILVQSIGAAFGSSLQHPTPAVSLTANFVFDAAFVVAALYLSYMGGRPSAAEFGYRLVRWPVLLGVPALAFAGYFLVTLAYGSLFHLSGNDKLPNELGVHRHTAALVAAAVFVCVVAPIAEEFFFRGFFFGTLMRMRVRIAGREAGPWIAAVITAILFGLAHLGSASAEYLVPLGLLGFVLCLIRWRTGSLYPCMALHSFNNCLALGINQESWSPPAIVALIVGAFAVIALLTVPLARATAKTR